MILGYAKLANAKEKILNGIKITTIREDKHNRWKVGRTIQHSLGVRTTRYEKFMDSVCTHIQTIVIDSFNRSVLLDGEYILAYRIKEIAINDGFDSLDEFYNFFEGKQDTPMKLIHWTDKYFNSPYNALPF